MVKRSDINFIGSTSNPLSQLVSYSLGGPQASTIRTPLNQAVAAQLGLGNGESKGNVEESSQALASQTLGAGKDTLKGLGKSLLSHISNNLLQEAPSVVNPLGLAMSFGFNQATKAVFGGSPADYVSAAIKDAIATGLSPEYSLNAKATAPAGYETNLSALVDNSLFSANWGNSRALSQMNAVANAVNTNSSDAIGYGSGVGVGGALGGGVGSMGSSGSYGQGGSYGGGGI